MNKQLEAKLKQLPRDPGVYFYKDTTGEVIYVGKAAILKNRVRQYFQTSRPFDPKTTSLVAEIYDVDWITVETELDALFLESEMIKRYKPRYNILLRDDKSQIYIRIPMKEVYPAVTYTRAPLDDKALYFGPYYNGWTIKKAMKYLRKVFPYSTHETMPNRVCLQYHIGLCPGVEEAKISENEYKKTLRKLILYLEGKREVVVEQIEKEMKSYAKKSEFEEAAESRNQLQNLKELQRQIIFSDREFMDISKDEALTGLKELLGLPHAIHRIEGYDISHMQGTNNVASMVVATNGLADKAQYRKFKMVIPGNDDFAHMRETLSRRFSGRHKDWPTPDLLLIDGGKGQLSAAISALEANGVQIPVVGLAKREEEIIVHKTGSHVTLQADLSEAYISSTSDDFTNILLPKQSHIIKLLQRIRDESHRFAVSYHTHLKRTGQVKSVLDDIPGVGPTTRKKLLKAFGSVQGTQQASIPELASVVGLVKAKVIKAHLP